MLDSLKGLVSIVLTLGLFAPIFLLKGWTRLAAGSAAGALLFCALRAFSGKGFQGGGLLSGAIAGLLISLAGAYVKEKLWPKRLRPVIVPEAWEPAAGLEPLTAEDKHSRLNVATSAAASASAFGLVAVAIFEQDFWKGLTAGDLIFKLVVSGVVGWIGARSFDPIRHLTVGKGRRHEEESEAGILNIRRQAVKPSLRTQLKIAVIVLFGLVTGDFWKDILKHGLEATGGLGVYVLVANTLTAGVVTYYWSAAVQYRAPSVAWRAAVSSTTLGAVITSPFALLAALSHVAVARPGGNLPNPAGAFLFYALFFGVVLFGSYAMSGGWALGLGRRWPVHWRVFAGLIPVVIIYTVAGGLLTPLSLHIELAMSDWLQLLAGNLMMAVGWALGIWLDKGSGRALNPEEQFKHE